MIEKLMRSSTHPPVASSMTNLQDDIIYTMIEQTDGSVLFADINDDTALCAAYVSDPFMNNLLNIYTGTGVTFHHYERMIESFFPHPNCQILSFNIPDLLQTDMYEKYPRVMAVLLNGYTKESSLCTRFVHNVTSPSIPPYFVTAPG